MPKNGGILEAINRALQKGEKYFSSPPELEGASEGEADGSAKWDLLAPIKALIYFVESVFMMIFVLFLFLVAALFVLIMAGSPIKNWLEAEGWPAVDCTIVRSDYLMEYSYVWEDEEYTSESYDFASFWSQTSESEYARYPEGATAICFVNPERPEKAVLSKSFSIQYLVGLAALFPMGIGLLLVFAMGLPKFRRRSESSDEHSAS
jgi:hypothetical protein